MSGSFLSGCSSLPPTPPHTHTHIHTSGKGKCWVQISESRLGLGWMSWDLLAIGQNAEQLTHLAHSLSMENIFRSSLKEKGDGIIIIKKRRWRVKGREPKRSYYFSLQ